MLTTDEKCARQGKSLVEKSVKAHKILRPFNVRPLYLVVKGDDPKTGAADPGREADGGAAGSKGVLDAKNLLYKRRPQRYDSNGVRCRDSRLGTLVGGDA